MDENQAVVAFAALSNQTRLRILRSLVQAGKGGLTAGEISTAVNASASRASFHLSSLASAGLIRSQRSAKNISYWVDFEVVGGLVNYLVHDCCKDDGKLLSCCLPIKSC